MQEDKPRHRLPVGCRRKTSPLLGGPASTTDADGPKTSPTESMGQPRGDGQGTLPDGTAIGEFESLLGSEPQCRGFPKGWTPSPTASAETASARILSSASDDDGTCRSRTGDVVDREQVSECAVG